MASSKKKIKRMFVLFIISFFYSLGQGLGIDPGRLHYVSNVTQLLLQFTSIPEVRNLLYNFKNNYRSSSVPDILSLYEIYDEYLSYASENALNTVGEKCGDDLNHFLNKLGTPWALRMLDSTGKLQSGVLRGASSWPGQYTECINTYSPLDEEGHGGFYGQYCVLSWTQNITAKYSMYPFRIGICVPDSCSGENIKAALKNAQHEFSKVLKTKKSYLALNSVICNTKKDRSLDWPSIIYVCIVFIFIILTVVGSLLTLYRPNTDPVSSSKSIFCFSAFYNARKIMDTENVEGQLLTVHGIRVLSFSWVILGHTYMYVKYSIGNGLDFLKSMDNLFSEVIIRSTLAIESFFLLSGFLVTYLFLKVASQRKIIWRYFYLFRIWRLSVPYLTVVFFNMLISKHIGSGPYWDTNICDTERSSWWKYVLYLQNFSPVTDICGEWLWYIAADTQFYIISPMFLYPLWKWPKIGFTILGSILFASWSITGMISYSHDLIPPFAGLAKAEYHKEYFQRQSLSVDLIYSAPYCRIDAYIIGAVLGYIFYRTGDKKDFLNWWQQLLGWLIALICLLISVFGLYHVELTRTVCLFYNVFGGTSFSVGLAWIIYACETGHGGFVTKILSWKLFIPLSRLTYCAYLVHGIILAGYYSSYLAPLHFTHTIAIVNFIGFFNISYGLAFIFSLVFESPFMNLMTLIRTKVKEQ